MMEKIGPDELRRLVEAIVQALLTEMGGAAPSPERKPLVLFLLTGAANGHERALELIAATREKARVLAYAGCCYTERFGKDKLIEALGCPDRHLTGLSPQKREELADKATVVALLQPMRSTVAKTARGITDSAMSQLLSRALMHGKTVLCAGGEVDTASWPASMPEAMRFGEGSLGELVKRDLERLASWGMVYRRDPMELFSVILGALKGSVERVAALPPSVGAVASSQLPDPGRRQFLTAVDVRMAHAEGKRMLSCAPNCIITDEARDVAAALHVSLGEG